MAAMATGAAALTPHSSSNIFTNCEASSRVELVQLSLMAFKSAI